MRASIPAVLRIREGSFKPLGWWFSLRRLLTVMLVPGLELMTLGSGAVRYDRSATGRIGRAGKLLGYLDPPRDDAAFTNNWDSIQRTLPRGSMAFANEINCQTVERRHPPGLRPDC